MRDENFSLHCSPVSHSCLYCFAPQVGLGASKERMEREMSDIQKTLELEGMLLRAAEEKLLALEAENAALRELLERAKWHVLDVIAAARKE
jgi:hypothetical protein